MAPKPTTRGEYIETETGNKISRRASILGTKHIILAGKCVIQHDVLVHGDLVTPRPPTASSASAPTKPGVTKDSTTTSKTSAPATETISIHLGRYVFISPHVTLHPPSRLSSSTSSSSSSTNPSSSTPNPLPPTTPQPAQQSLTYHPLRIAEHVFIGPHSHIRAASIGSHVYIGSHVSVGNLVIVKDNVRVEDGSVLPAGSVWASGSVVAGAPARVVGEVGEGWAFGGGDSRERWAAVAGPGGGGGGKGR